jgi:Zn-finger nucleic acid-binding protein
MIRGMDQPGSCPRCGQTLDRGTYGGVEVDLCPGCSGMLVARNRMIPLMEQLTAELVQTIDPDRQIEAIPPAASGIPCPGCKAPMEQHGYMGSDRVFVDSCDACNAAWLDPAGLGAMTLLWARTERRLVDRRVQQQGAEATSLVDAVMLGRRVQRSLLRGFVGRIGRIF